MEIYETVPKYDSKTGQKIGFQKVWKETRCDYTGQVLTEDDYPAYYCKFILDYEDQDACCGSDGEEFEFGDKYHVDMHQFLHQPYAIWNDSGDNSVMIKFLKEAVKYGSLDNALRSVRVKTATKLIKKCIIEPEQLEEVDI